MTGDRHIDKRSRLNEITLELHLGIIPAVTSISRFDQHLVTASHSIAKKPFQPLMAELAE